MLELITELGFKVIANIFILAAGSVLAVLLYNLSLKNKINFKAIKPNNVVVIILSSAIGLVMPFGTYGVIPLGLVLYLVGLLPEYILPFVFSNAMFNMAVSFTDTGFTWRNGIGRILLAFTAGILAVFILKLFKNKESAIRLGGDIAVFENKKISTQITAFITQSINSLGLYLIIGALLDVVFQKYLITAVVNFVFINSSLGNTFSFLLNIDIANAYFLYVFNLFVNFAGLFALLRFLKLKGLTSFVLSYLMLAVAFYSFTFVF